MGLSLRNITRKVWETVTPQNEAALRAGQTSLNAANQRLQALGRPPVAPAPQFNMPQAVGQSAVEAGRDVLLRPVARGVLRIGASAIEPITHQPQIQPEGPVLTTIFGNKPVETYGHEFATNRTKRGVLPAVGMVGLSAATDLPVGPGRAKVLKPSVGLKPPVVKPTVLGKPQKPLTIDQQLETAILGRRGTPQFKERPLGVLSEKLSINRQARKLTKPIEVGADRLVRASLESGSRIVRTPGRAIVGISKQAGKSPEELQRLGQYGGQKELGDIYAKSISRSGEQAIKQGVRPEAVVSALDPKLHLARGGKPYELTPLEASEAARLRKIINVTHEGNYQLGLLDSVKYKANKGTYFPRDMSKFFEDDPMRQISKNNKMELNIFKPRKDLSDIPKDVLDAAETDPYFLTALRVQQYQRNKAFVQYSDWLSKYGSISPGPRKGYVQIPVNKAYGSLAGKHILKEQAEDLQGFIYETGAAQDMMSLLNRYDRLGIRRGRKALLTIFNPGVRIGNRTFNNLVAGLNGINPITFNKNWVRGGRMMKGNSPEYIEATRAGIFSPSMIQKELYRTQDITPRQGAFKRGIKAVGDTYQAVDDKAKMATYLTFRERGLSVAEAAERTRRIQQNYDLVGFMFDQGAKTPLVGNAFIRFSSELMRIAHNTAADNPVRLATAAVAATTLVSLASKMSGETPEDRKTREDRLGAPRVPFTHQSLEFQTPWGAINAGRLLGLTTYNDLTGGVQEDVKRYLPWQIPVNKDKTGYHLNPQSISADPLLGGLASVAINRDFRGKPITDPDVAKYPDQPLPKDQQNKNRLNYLRMAYQPYATEGNSIKASVQGKENYYGQKRSVAQSLLRVGGIKVEQYGPKKAAEQRDKNEYFSNEYAQANDWKRQHPDLAQTYDKFKGREKDRQTGKKFFDLVTPERWRLVQSDSSGELYRQLRKEALDAKSPVDPIFKLNDLNRVREVLQVRSTAPGDKIEQQEILRATSGWYPQFEKAETEFNKANTEYFSKLGLPDTRGERARAYSDVPHPEQPPIVKRYYEIKNKDAQAAKDFFRANADSLSSAFDSYRSARLKEINSKREILGLDPIKSDTFNNVTFGYEDDERKVFNQLKYGKGFGGFSSGNSTPSAYKYALKLKKPPIPAPKVSVKKGSAKSKKTAIAKPKVTIKKSKV